MVTEMDEVRLAGEPGDFTGRWDPAFMRRVVAALRPIAKGWHRSEVRGLDRMPEGGALNRRKPLGRLLRDGYPGVRDRLS
jgi:hypothetical protein